MNGLLYPNTFQRESTVVAVSDGELFPEAPLELLCELGAELGMRDRDQLLGALAQGLAAQLRHAVFGYNIVCLLYTSRCV